MKVLKILAIIIIIALIGIAIAAPIGPLPGFMIGGTGTATPAVWEDTSKTHEIKLKVPGTPPRVVIIWVVQQAGELYVVGDPESGWVKRIGNGGPVSMRLADRTYELEAERITQDTDSALTAYVDKYRPDYPEIVADFPTGAEAAGAFALFRLNRS